MDQRLIGPGVVEGRGHVDVSIHQDEQRPLKTAREEKGQPDAEESVPNRFGLLRDRRSWLTTRLNVVDSRDPRNLQVSLLLSDFLQK